MSCIDLLGRTWASPVAPAPMPQSPSQTKGQVGTQGDLPDPPPLTGDRVTVDEAWEIFGIPQKRAPRGVVKSRYLAFAAKWHPDRCGDDVRAQAEAHAQLTRANAAWTLLQRHCRW